MVRVYILKIAFGTQVGGLSQFKKLSPLQENEFSRLTFNMSWANDWALKAQNLTPLSTKVF